MTTGDETRSDGRPSLFGDDGTADDTQVVQNPYPAGQPSRRPPVQPPDRGGPGAPPPDYGRPPVGYGHAPGPGDDGGLFDQQPYQREPAGGPNILANQAVDWERNLQEASVTRSSRTGLIALFLLGLIVVAVVALGLAAWSVLRGGGDTAADETGETPSDSTTDSTVDGATPNSVDPATGGADAGGSSTVPDPNALQVTVTEDPFACDGATREFAQLAGADPNESVAFTSPQASGLRSGQADVNGQLPIRWQCDADQAGTTWELTATGETSGRSVTFIFAGVTAGDAGAGTGAGAGSGTSEPAELTVEVIDDPFICDGATKVFAQLSGAEPNEAIAFSSPQSPDLRPGEADSSGQLPLRWQCDPDQVGTTWELTATGDTSGRTITFSFTGGAATG